MRNVLKKCSEKAYLEGTISIYISSRTFIACTRKMR